MGKLFRYIFDDANRILGFMLFLIGCYLLGTGVYKNYKTTRTRLWTKTEAEVLSSKLRDEYFTEITGSRGRTSDVLKYKALIKYRYKVGNSKKDSEVVGLYYDYTDEKYVHENIVNSYKVGDKVTAYYNPKKPYEAVLITRSINGFRFNFVVGIICWICALLAFIVKTRIVYK